MTVQAYDRPLLPVVYEHWLPVVGWEGLYEVSCRGRVRSLDRLVRYIDGRVRLHTGQVLAPATSHTGYKLVSLVRQGKARTRFVHHLVLEAFDRRRRPGEECRHGPGGPADNRWPGAICWGTKSENHGPDRVRDGTSNRGERQGRAKLTEAVVIECRHRYAAGESQRALAAEFGVSPATVNEAVRGITWKHIAS